MINRIINRHLRLHERGLPLRDRLSRWHMNRVAYDKGPIMWTLQWVWWIPGLQWLYQLRCSNVTWRINRHNRRALREAPDLYNWGRE